MNPYADNGGNGGPVDDDFDDLIRDAEYDFDEPIADEHDWDDPSSAYRRYSARTHGRASFNPAGGERSVAEALSRLIELLGTLAGEALPVEARRQVEGMTRDLLVVLRDTLDLLIERLDEHNLDDDVEIEEIRID